MTLKASDIRKFLVLGSGTLGLRIALQAAISGFDTTVYDISEHAFGSAQKIQGRILKDLIEKGRISTADAEAARLRIRFTLDPVEAANNADFVSESVVEDLAVKKQVWSLFAGLCPPHAVFTTNTSYMLPSWFAAETGRPELFCAFHFHDVFYSRVVDIMPHPGTDPSLIGVLEELGRKLNQVPVIVRKENPGYLFNTMLMALLGAAGKLITREVGSIEDIDKSWMVNFHMPMGPFGILDSIGLDTAWHVTHKIPDSASQACAAHLKTYIDQGKLGEKTGEGFYTYPNPRYREVDFIR
jgi:3-hydroxybutyryl-CoA dehydrogenase